jgi:predicted MFS family arabinose efflux permease
VTNNANSEGYLISKGYSYYVFTLLFLLYMFDYIDRMVVVSLFPFIKAEWGVTDTECGMLVSAVSWSIVILTFPVSVLIDRWSRKKCIGFMAVAWSLATAACALTGKFWQLFTARAFIGFGESGYAPGGTAMISALFPEDKRARIMGIWNASIPLGAAIGIAIGGVIAETFGWRYAFGIVAAPGLIVALLFFWIKDYKSVELTKTVAGGAAAEKHEMTAKEIAGEFVRTPSLVLTYLGFAATVFATAALLSWLPTFLHRIHGISMTDAGLKSGMVMLLAIVGSPLGGFLADKWQKRNVRGRLLLISTSSWVSCVIFLIAFVFAGPAFRYPVLCLGGIAAAAFVPGASAVTQDVVHPGLRAISFSLCVIVQHLLGTALGPVFVGVVSDSYGISTAFELLPIAFFLAGVFFFAGSFFYARDVAKVEKVKLEIEE